MNEDLLLQYQELADKILGKENLTKEESFTSKQAAFKQYFEELKQVQLAVRKVNLEEKLQVLKVEEAMISNVAKPKKARKWILLFVGLMIGLLILGFLKLNSSPGYDKDLLIADYFTPYSIEGIERSESHKKLEDAYQLYSDAGYSVAGYNKAITSFQELVKKDNSPKHKFYLGVSLIGSGKYDKAIKILSDPAVKNLEFPTNFYLGLANIGSGNNSQAKKHLSDSKNQDAFYRDESKKLLERIERKN